MKVLTHVIAAMFGACVGVVALAILQAGSGREFRYE